MYYQTFTEPYRRVCFVLRIDVRKCVPGMTLALPVVNPRVEGQVLLKANFQLSDASIKRLVEMGISWVWLSYPSLDFLEKFVNQAVLKAQGPVVKDITQTFELIQNQSAAKLPYDSYTSSIGTLVGQLLANPQATLFMGDLTSSDHPDRALMRHSAAVTYISLLMGLKLEGYLIRQRKHVDPAQAKEVIQLGIGAMLHDIGVTLLDDKVRQQFQKTGQDDDAWREHTAKGYQLVRGKISSTAATIVLNHHQRFDGSGYGATDSPALDGERMHVFARVVSLADYFDECRYPQQSKNENVQNVQSNEQAEQSDQNSCKCVTAVAVLRHLLEPEVFKQFDPHVVRALFTVVPPYPPGSMVKLSDGRWAAAVDHNPQDPCRPTVQIIPGPDGKTELEATAGDTIDLSKEDSKLVIAEFEDQDVTAYNFPAPKIMSESLAMSFM